MATVSVEKSVVEKSIVLCDRTIQQYRQVAAYLDRPAHWHGLKKPPHRAMPPRRSI